MFMKVEIIAPPQTDCGMIIPIEVVCKNGEGCVIAVSGFEKVAEEFCRRFDERTAFSRQAFDMIREEVTPILEKAGFVEIDLPGIYVRYRLKASPIDSILESTVRLDGRLKLENLTECDIDALIGFGHLCFGTVCGGKLLSVAYTTSPYLPNENRRYEIGVETAEECRRCGYGLSNAASVTGAIIAAGCEAVYETSLDNTASLELVKKFDAEEIYRSFPVVAYL